MSEKKPKPYMHPETRANIQANQEKRIGIALPKHRGVDAHWKAQLAGWKAGKSRKAKEAKS